VEADKIAGHLANASASFAHASTILTGLAEALQRADADAEADYRRLGQPVLGAAYDKFSTFHLTIHDQVAYQARQTAAAQLSKLAKQAPSPIGAHARVSAWSRVEAGAEVALGGLLVLGGVAAAVATDGVGSPLVAGAVEEDAQLDSAAATELAEAEGQMATEYALSTDSSLGTIVTQSGERLEVASLDASEAADGHPFIHIGQPLEDLQARMASQPDLPGSTTFFDGPTAASAVSDALRTGAVTWRSSSVAQLTVNLGRPIGYGVDASGRVVQNIETVEVILVRDAGGFIVKTAYPLVGAP
jgi:hypothetical protein